jgi:hypothetical protein
LLSSDLENRIPRPIVQLYNLLHSIVSENGIIRQEKENTKEKIELIVRTTMNLQNTLMNQRMKNQWDFERIIKSMKNDIEA